MGRVACETLVTTGLVVIAGEITTNDLCGFREVSRVTSFATSATRARNMASTPKPARVICTVKRQSPRHRHGRGYRRRGRSGPDVRLRLRRDGRADAHAHPTRAPPGAAPLRSSQSQESSISSGPTASRKSPSNISMAARLRVDSVVISTQHSDSVSNEDLHEAISNERHPARRSRDNDGQEHASPHQSHRTLRRRRTDGRRRPDGPQNYCRHLRRLQPSRRRRAFGQGSDQGGSFRLLHGALHREKPRRCWSRAQSSKCSLPTPSASPNRFP